MILAEIRDYVRERGRVSLAELVNRFDTPPDALRGMLDQWVRRGKMRPVVLADHCRGCTQCDPLATEFYEWRESTVIGEQVIDSSAICRR